MRVDARPHPWAITQCERTRLKILLVVEATGWRPYGEQRVALEWEFRYVRTRHQAMMKSKYREHHRRPSNAKLSEMIAEATVDAYGESEESVGFFTLLEDRLKLPFKTELLGIEVAVERLEMTDDEQIVAVCSRRKSRQRVPILDLPLPSPPPEGAEWIDAYRRWSRGR